MNYISHFKSLKEVSYTLYLIENDSEEFQEIYLDGNSPVSLQYETSSSPFEPIRTSVLTINAVWDEYMDDLLQPHADDVMVILHNDTKGEDEFVGYLQQNTMNNGYEQCYEHITLTASDFLLVSQFKKYQLKDVITFKQVVSFKDILVDFCNMFPLCQGFYWSVGDKFYDGDYVIPEYLSISEYNFFSSDTDEPWDYQEVITEMCKYVGLTCLQIGAWFYFVDYNTFTRSNKITAYKYFKADDFDEPIEVSFEGVQMITEDSYMGSGHDISFLPIYNKIKVVDSFYEADSIIPSIFDDNKSKNMYGENKKTCHYIQMIDNPPRYFNDKGNYEFEDEDSKKYYNRILKHDDWESVYYSNRGNYDSGTETNYEDYANFIVLNAFETMDVASPDIVAFVGCVVEVRNYISDSPKTFNVKLKYAGNDYAYNEQTITIDGHGKEVVSFNLFINNVRITDTHYGEWTLIVNDTYSAWNTGAIQTETTLTKGLIGGTLVELGVDDKGNEYPNSDIPFTKYICVSQYDMPNVRNESINYILQPSKVYQLHKPVFRLQSKNAPAVIIAKDSSFTINVSAIWERYRYYDYINDDWTTTKSGEPRISYADKVWKTSPAYLTFRFGVGNMFWNGSEWVENSEVAFAVEMDGREYDDNAHQWKNAPKWNTSMNAINNISWKEWTGGSGYRIPISNTINLNGKITFEILMPNKFEDLYTTAGEERMDMNGYVWISALDVQLITKNSEFDTTDILYENVIDNEAVNEYSDINLKMTTYPKMHKMSYSHIGFKGAHIDKVIEKSLYGSPLIPEMNIIEKYYNQFSTKTTKEDVVVNRDFSPLKPIVDTYWEDDKVFAVVGQEIDYLNDRQTLSIMEIKKIYAPLPSPTLSISSTGTTLSYSENSGHFDYTYDGLGKITTEPSDSWIESYISGGKVYFNVAKNDYSLRNGYIDVSDGAITKTFYLEQAGKGISIVAEPQTLNVGSLATTGNYVTITYGGNPQDKTFTFTKSSWISNIVWSSSDWMKRGSDFERTLFFDVAANTDNYARSGNIKISDGTIDTTINIRQRAAYSSDFEVYYNTHNFEDSLLEPADWVKADKNVSIFNIPSNAFAVAIEPMVADKDNMVNMMQGKVNNGSTHYVSFTEKKHSSYYGNMDKYTMDTINSNYVYANIPDNQTPNDALPSTAFIAGYLFGERDFVEVEFFLNGNHDTMTNTTIRLYRQNS